MAKLRISVFFVTSSVLIELVPTKTTHTHLMVARATSGTILLCLGMSKHHPSSSLGQDSTYTLRMDNKIDRWDLRVACSKHKAHRIHISTDSRAKIPETRGGIHRTRRTCSLSVLHVPSRLLLCEGGKILIHAS